MRTPLYAVLAVLCSGCAMLGGGDTGARLDAMEQQMAVVIERIGTIEESNEEVMQKVEELARDTSTNQRLALLEEKQAGVEKMQLELASHQDSLKASMAKIREYVEMLKERMDKLTAKQKASATERRRKRLEERLRQRAEEEARIEEIPRKSIIKLERPTAGLRREGPPPEPETTQKPSSSVRKKKKSAAPLPAKKKEPALPQPPAKRGEPKGGFILEDF